MVQSERLSDLLKGGETRCTVNLISNLTREIRSPQSRRSESTKKNESVRKTQNKQRRLLASKQTASSRSMPPSWLRSAKIWTLSDIQLTNRHYHIVHLSSRLLAILIISSLASIRSLFHLSRKVLQTFSNFYHHCGQRTLDSWFWPQDGKSILYKKETGFDSFEEMLESLSHPPQSSLVPTTLPTSNHNQAIQRYVLLQNFLIFQSFDSIQVIR